MDAPFGVLALQGDFAAHAAAFRHLGVPVREVRRVAELEGLGGLMIPGGESTTLLNLMRDEPWFEAIRSLHASGAVVAGTCAGAILLSREVRPRQGSLALLDAVIERNAFGRQVDSFEARVDAPALGGEMDAVFIRAPRFRALFPGVEVLARHGGSRSSCSRAGSWPGPSTRSSPARAPSIATWPGSPAPAPNGLARRRLRPPSLSFGARSLADICHHASRSSTSIRIIGLAAKAGSSNRTAP